MRKFARVLIAFVALEHLGFLVLEMFLWTSPTGMQVFGLTQELAEQTSALAANQGLYNGFLAAGLIWSLVKKNDAFFAAGLFPELCGHCGNFWRSHGKGKHSVRSGRACDGRARARRACQSPNRSTIQPE